MRILIENCTVLDSDARFGYTENLNIVVDGNLIAYIGPDQENGSYDRVIDGKDCLAMPGLINSHTHSSEVYLKGTTDCLPLEMWLAHLFGTCGEYSPRDIYLSCIVGAIEMLKTGTTSVLDHLWLSPSLSLDRLDAAMQAYSDIGIRAAVAPLVDDIDRDVELAVREGCPLNHTFYGRRLDLQQPVQEIQDILDDFFKKWHGKHDGRLLCFAGLGGINWSSEDLLTRIARLAEKYNSMLHMHALETFAQAEVCRKTMFKTGIAMLSVLGLLGENISLAHGVWLNSDDIALLADSGAMVVHNPASNLKLGSGLAPVRKLIDSGIIVGLGTDGSASSDNQVMFDALKIAALKHNTTYTEHDKWISAREVMQMATCWGGHVMGYRDKLGRLEPGCLADLVLLNLNTPYLAPLNDAFRSLVFCETGASVETVIVDGAVVMDKGKITTVDEESLLREIRETVKLRKPRSVVNNEELEYTMQLLDGYLKKLNVKRKGSQEINLP